MTATSAEQEMGMRERLAKAMYGRNAIQDANTDVDGVQAGEPFDIPWDDLEECHPGAQAEWLSDADAVLAALNPPTEAMVSKGMHKLSEMPDDASWITLARTARDIYVAMLSVASEG